MGKKMDPEIEKRQKQHAERAKKQQAKKANDEATFDLMGASVEMDRRKLEKISPKHPKNMEQDDPLLASTLTRLGHLPTRSHKKVHKKVHKKAHTKKRAHKKASHRSSKHPLHRA